ncbi:MAG: hypothetical protein IKX50_02860 [Spirochaetia bacterium]|nr:hypothetical protein [Spirochaetia bacterium]
MINIRRNKKINLAACDIIIILGKFFIANTSYKKIESIIVQSEELNKIYENWIIIKNETVKYTINYPKIPYPLIKSVSNYEISMEKLLDEKMLNMMEKNIPYLGQELQVMISMWQEIQYKLIKSLFFNQDIGFFANEIIQFITSDTDNFETTLKATLAIYSQYLNERVKLNWILFMIGSSFSVFLAIMLGAAIFNYYKMSEKEKEIRDLSNSILEVRDKERTRIAADLHDEIVQNLVSLKFLDNINDIKAEIEKDITMVRNIAFNLRPPELSDSLEKSLQYFLADIERKTQIKTSLHFLCQNDYPFSQDLEIMIYRLIYEAVNNSVKHSKANSIDVKIIPVYPNIILRIEDNGIGFVYKNVQTQEHMGLKGMEGRVRTMNGVMKIKSELGKGTSIIFTIPDKRIAKIGKV